MCRALTTQASAVLLGRCVANNHPAAWRPLLLPQASTHTCTLCPHTVAQHWQPPPPPPYPLVPVNYCDRHQFLPRAVRRDTGLDGGQPVVSLGRSLGCWLMGGAELGDGWALPAPKVCDSKFLRNTVRFKGQTPWLALLSLGTSPRSRQQGHHPAQASGLLEQTPTETRESAPSCGLDR